VAEMIYAIKLSLAWGLPALLITLIWPDRLWLNLAITLVAAIGGSGLDSVKAVRNGVAWALGAFILLIVHPSSALSVLVVTVISCILGAMN